MKHFSNTDILIAGGTLADVYLAAQLARSGHTTALVMSGTAPAREFTTCLGAWLSDAERSRLPQDLLPCFTAAAAVSAERESGQALTMLNQAVLARGLEDYLLEAGVAIYYDATPAAVLRSNSCPAGVGGVVFGGKFGLSAATAAVTIDGTPNAALSRMNSDEGRQRADRRRSDRCRFVVTCASDHAHNPGWHDFVDGFRIRFHRQLAELSFSVGTSGEVFAAGRRNAAVRDAILTGSSAWAAAHPDLPLDMERAADDVVFVPERVFGQAVAGFQPDASLQAGGAEAVLTVGAASDAAEDVDASLDDRVRYAVQLTESIHSILDSLGEAVSHEGKGDAALSVAPSVHCGESTEASRSTPSGRYAYDDPSFEDPRDGRLNIDLPEIPCVAESQVLVAGLGTAGAMAAATASRLGLRTIGVDKHSDLGGVNTIGGVAKYWFGRRTPFFKDLHRTIRAESERKNVGVAMALWSLVGEAGPQVRTRTPFCGVVVDDRRVTGVLVIGESGLAVIAADWVIDASSDGDICAWAGARYSYGSERDEATMWCSFGHFQRGRKEASRQYQSVVDQRSVHDTVRGMIAGRRMVGVYGPGEIVQHYLATRESRHIHGRSSITYHDVMMGRGFEDAVLWFKSNIDIKGIASSRAVHCGFVERDFLQNYEVSFPYGAMTPLDLDNVLIAGKAHSATHDGLSMSRMQPDIMSLGTVAALAVRHLHDHGDRSVHDLSIDSLQETLYGERLLMAGDLPSDPQDERVIPDSAAIDDLVDRACTYPVMPDEWARMLSAPSATREKLRERLNDWPGGSASLTLARLACTLGDPGPADMLLSQVDQLLSDGAPGLWDRDRHDMPDHGWAPDPVYLINALAWAGDSRLVERLWRIRELIELDGTTSDYRFCYVHGAAYACEVLGSPDCTSLLQAWLSDPAIRARDVPRGGDPRATQEYIAERFAYLELCLGRALARCGSKEGYELLIRYTGDMRLYLARSALQELRELTGVDSGFDAGAWRQWLGSHEGEIGPCPVGEPMQ